MDISLELSSQFVDLDQIVTALKAGDVGPALRSFVFAGLNFY